MYMYVHLGMLCTCNIEVCPSSVNTVCITSVTAIHDDLCGKAFLISNYDFVILLFQMYVLECTVRRETKLYSAEHFEECKDYFDNVLKFVCIMCNTVLQLATN